MELIHVRPEDLPHKLREDDVYGGYHLEKDSLVMVNIWYVLSPLCKLSRRLLRVSSSTHLI